VSQLPLPRRHRPLVALLLAGLLSACSTPGDDPGALYTALGGKPGIDAITDRFLYHLADNERALPLFLNTDIGRFREQFSTQLCDIAGGPCTYRGDTMAATHRGMNIDRAQFNSVVEDLISAMEDQDVPVTAQNALLQRLAPLYGEISRR
jgi:hemoglobin